MTQPIDAAAINPLLSGQSLADDLTGSWTNAFGASNDPTVSPLLAAVIPALDASKITTGLFSSAQVPNISAGTGPGQSSDLATHLSNVFGAFLGTTEASDDASATDAANMAMTSLFNMVVGLSNQMQQSQTQQTGLSQSGQSYQVDFSDYPDGAFPPIFHLTYTGPGSGYLSIKNGNAYWNEDANGDRSAKGIYLGGLSSGQQAGVNITDTDYQELQATIGGLPDVGAINYALLRVSADEQSFVWACMYRSGTFALTAELGCWVNGTNYPLGQWSAPISLGFTFRAGVGNNPRRFQGVSGNNIVFDYDDSIAGGGTAITPLGAAYRGWGFMSITADNGSHTPAPAAFVGVTDNAPPAAQVGSGAQKLRLSNTVTSALTTTPKTGLAFPAGFFDTAEPATSDLTATGDGYTIGLEGWYIVTIRALLDTWSVATSATMAVISGCIIKTSGSTTSVFVGTPGAFAANPAAASQFVSPVFGSTILAYFEEGDVIVPGYFLSGTGTNILKMTGDPTGLTTYWTIELANRSYQ